MTQIKHYQLKGNPVVEAVPVVGNLVYDEVGREVLALHNERFKGVNRIEDRTDYSEGRPLSFSNIPRALSYAKILREKFQDMHVLTPEEVVRYWNALPERDSTYADTSSISLFPKEGPNEELRRQVLNLAERTQTDVPLVVDGLTPDRTGDSFALTRTDRFKVTEAPYLRKDGFVKYNQETDKVEQCKEGDKGSVRLYVPDSQSGLRGLYRDRDELYSRYDDLLSSNEAGRVQLVQEPLARAENF